MWKTTDHEHLKIAVLIDNDTVVNAMELRNAQDA